MSTFIEIKNPLTLKRKKFYFFTLLQGQNKQLMNCREGKAGQIEMAEKEVEAQVANFMPLEVRNFFKMDFIIFQLIVKDNVNLLFVLSKDSVIVAIELGFK